MEENKLLRYEMLSVVMLSLVLAFRQMAIVSPFISIIVKHS